MRQIITRAKGTPVPTEAVELNDSTLLEISRHFSVLSDIYWYRDLQLKLLNSTLAALNTSERSGLTPELPPAYAAFCIVTGFAGRHSWAEGYAEKALESSERLGDEAVRATVLSRLGLYFATAGRWRDLDRIVPEGIEICRRIGNETVILDLLTEYAFSLSNQGRYEEGLKAWRDFEELAVKHPHRLSHCQYGSSAIYLKQGKSEAALESVLLAKENLYPSPVTSQYILVAGLSGAAYRRLGKEADALAAAKEAVQFLDKPALNFGTLDGYVGLLETFSQSRDEGAEENTKKVLQSLRTFAARCPIGMPQSLLWQAGTLDLAPGKRLKLLQRGLASARSLAMPFDEALIHGETARLRGGSLGDTHKVQARELLDELGAVDIREVEE